MRNYGPEILMGLILCLTLALTVQKPQQTGQTPAAVQAETIASAEAAETTETAEATEAQEPESSDLTQTIRLVSGGEVRELTLREYLIGVIMSEMPMSFEPEALRAQAIASRTYALHCRKHDGADVCDRSACCQCWQDEQSRRERFGADYESLREKAGQAVDSTDGLVLQYRGMLIDATYFACSGGRTEDAVEVWGREVPYLRPVASPGEEDARSYHSRVELEAEAFAQAVRTLAPASALTGDPADWIGEEERTSGDGVRTLELGGAALTGTELRDLFGLNSTKFTLTWDGERFCFDVYGSGHRVGMSQCGAQAMALAGATAEQILETYYTGVEISHI